MFWVIVWISYSIFVRETGDFSLVSLDPCSIHHSIYFGCDYFPCFDADCPSLTFPSLCLLLYLFYSSISPYFILFLSFLILLNVWLGFSVHTLFLLIWCVHSFIITFCVRTPRSRTHDIFYALHFMHEGYGGYIIRIFEPSFHSFCSPYYLGLRYVPHLKTTLRLLLRIVFDGSHGQYLRLVGDYFLRHDRWGVEAMDLHWGIPFLSVMDFRRWYDLYWGIPYALMTFSFEMMPCTEA